MQDFLRSLRESGEVTVATGPPSELDERVSESLREHEAAVRSGLSPGAPELVLDAAYWGARMLYRACQLFTMRDAPPAVAEETLSQPYGGARSPAVDYSVDLTLSYLPSLFVLAERVAPADPVLDVVRAVAASWPLSSVGIGGIGGIGGIARSAELPFWPNDCLRSLYLDRILAKRALDRLDDPEVASSVRARIGAYPELAPKVVEHLETNNV